MTISKNHNPFDPYLPTIIQVIRNARKAPFWRRKLPEKIDSIRDFRECPITTREELIELYNDGKWSELLTTSAKRSHIIATSGGKPFRPPFVSYYSQREFDQVSKTVTDMFASNRIKDGKILIVFPGVMPYPPSFSRKIYPTNGLEPYQSQHISGVLFKHACLHSCLKTYCSGLRFLAYKVSKKEAIMEKTRIIKAFSIVKPNILAVSPNILRNVFFREFEENKLTFSDFNTYLIINGGARLEKDDFERLSALGNPEIISWIESGEVGTIGYSKRFSPNLHFKNVYYQTTWQSNFFETVDKDGHPLPFGSRGRIVVTRLNTFTQPLVRYDLEDEGKFYLIGKEIFLGNDFVKL